MHPEHISSTSNGVSASIARPGSPGVDALADLAALLADPSTRAWALSALPGGRDNEAVKRASGAAPDLFRESDSSWAIVVQPAPTLMVFDLDDCADITLPALCDAADDASTTVVAIVDSGRSNCRHLWLAPPTSHAREYILHTARWLRTQHSLSPSALDERSGKTIRLPGSAPLKDSGARARVVDADGNEVPISVAVAAARDALCGRPLDQIAQASLTYKAKSAREWPRMKRAYPRSATKPEATTPLSFPVDAPLGRPVVETPRAWRRRTVIDSQGWATLNDADSDDRSAAATAGAWILFRHGIRSFARARWWYEHLPCFDKFRHRDETKASRESTTNQWESCRQHWNTVRDRGINHRLPMTKADEAIIAAARAEANSWSEPLLQAAALVVIDRRFATGHGLTDRPIARRDLQLWLHLSDGTATTVLARLREIGFLKVAGGHTPQGEGARSAATYDLHTSFTPVDSAHDVTNHTATLTHPLWGSLGHTPRLAWETLSTSPTALSTRELSTLTGLAPGDHKSGLLHILRVLRSLGAVESTGTGRWTRWMAGSAASLDAAAIASGASARAQEIAARINAERSAWHAETREEAGRAVRGLEILRSRLHHADAVGSPRRPHFVARSGGAGRRPRGTRRTNDASFEGRAVFDRGS